MRGHEKEEGMLMLRTDPSVLLTNISPCVHIQYSMLLSEDMIQGDSTAVTSSGGAHWSASRHAEGHTEAGREGE